MAEDGATNQSALSKTAVVRRASLELDLSSTGEAVAKAVSSIVQLLPYPVDSAEAKRLELALDEAVRNAYEHGNLGISSEEKEALITQDTFEEELHRREQEAMLQGKRIRVFVEVDETELRCRIQDDGEGFDWNAMSVELSTAEISPTAVRGRGLPLIFQLFDTVSYNEKGNELRVSKRL